PVFDRYLEVVAGRVKEFGGDPINVQPSPTGDGKTRGHPCRPDGHEEGLSFTGKVDGLIYDRYGDFDGFLLSAAEREHRFHSREKETARLVERAWHERLRITVFAAHHDWHSPMKIVVHQPPVTLGA